MGLQSSAHARFDLKYHFVWCPKYRRVVLEGNIGNYVAKIIRKVAERYDFEIRELAVMPDHVHMFVAASPRMSPSRIVKLVKGITAKKIFERFPSVKKKLWGGHLWTRGYFVMSSGEGTTDEMIRKYISEQRNPDEAQASDGPNLFGP